MAVTIGNTTLDQDQVSGTTTHNNNGDFLLCSIDSTSNNITAVTFDGVSMTQIGTAQFHNAYSRYMTVWSLVAPSTGSKSLVATGGANWQFQIVSFSGVDQTTPYTGLNTASGNGENSTISVTTTVNNAYVIDVCILQGLGDAGTNTTRLIDGWGGAFYTMHSTNPVATAGSFTINTTHPSGDYIHKAIGVNPVATTPTFSPRMMLI